MAAHDKNLASAIVSDHPTPDAPVTRASRSGAHDKPAVIVWRVSARTVDEEDVPGTSDTADSPLTLRLARHLVAIYSDVHDTVVDFDADDNLRRAAEATGRVYRPAHSPIAPVLASDQPGRAGLMVLRWPRQTTSTPEQDAQNLLSNCKQHLAATGSMIIIVRAAQPGAAGTSYHEHEQILLTAAHAAGLWHLHDIVPLDADDDRDAFTYATAPDRDNSADTPRQTDGTTLVIFGHPGRRP